MSMHRIIPAHSESIALHRVGAVSDGQPRRNAPKRIVPRRIRVPFGGYARRG